MAYTVKKNPSSEIEFTITVTPEEYANDIVRAAERLSARVAIKGFRKGKVPFDVAKRELGSMQLLQEALEEIVSRVYAAAVKQEDIDAVGMPKISITKLAPDNDIIFTATVALLPEVKLPDWKKISIKKKTALIPKEKLEETLSALRGMHAKEIKKDGIAEGTDKLVIDMNMTHGGVPLDGGQSKDYAVYLSENHYIPGFNDAVRGMKAGETKQFVLSFPNTHYQKHLAGKEVSFSVTAKDVFERQLPELNDEFAKKLGQESLEKLRVLVLENITHEAEQKAEKDIEVAMLEAVMEKTSFSVIPETLIDAERERMFYELKRDLEKNGITIEQYLADIKKTEKEIYADFRTQAEKRAKAALLSREIAKQETLSPSKEDIDAEIALIASYYKDDAQTQENLKRAEVRDSIATTVQNRKVMEWLKKTILA